ncbi:MAG: GtrA family protein [Clostridiales bacterium]|nr:GtrA family protein [Clostridiales bacterium]HOA85615.1 GtrA family protein [Bacillota bacterium]
MEKEKIKSLFFEFLRYAVVGGVAALVDMAVNYAMLFYILGATKDDKWQVAVSVAAGFVVGIVVNYILANIFVFRTAEQRRRGMTAGAFAIYTIVGIIGFGITEGLTILGTYLIGEEGIWYIILTCVVKGIILFWNYLGRKIFVYKGK